MRIGTLVDHNLAERLGVRGIRAQRSLRQLRELVALYQQDALRITVRATFALEDIAEAHREVETGHGKGKVVVIVNGCGSRTCPPAGYRRSPNDHN